MQSSASMSQIITNRSVVDPDRHFFLLTLHPDHYFLSRHLRIHIIQNSQIQKRFILHGRIRILFSYGPYLFKRDQFFLSYFIFLTRIGDGATFFKIIGSESDFYIRGRIHNSKKNTFHDCLFRIRILKKKSVGSATLARAALIHVSNRIGSIFF